MDLGLNPCQGTEMYKGIRMAKIIDTLNVSETLKTLLDVLEVRYDLTAHNITRTFENNSTLVANCEKQESANISAQIQTNKLNAMHTYF